MACRSLSVPNLKQRADWPGTIGSASRLQYRLFSGSPAWFPPIAWFLPQCFSSGGQPSEAWSQTLAEQLTCETPCNVRLHRRFGFGGEYFGPYESEYFAREKHKVRRLADREFFAVCDQP